jgi:hypothetical protein
MRNTTRGNATRRTTLASAFALATTLGLVAMPALGVDNGPTEVGQICMQKLYGTPVNSSNRLNCTANDIRLSRAISVSQESCVRGTTFDLTATFETIVTANARYDAGFFFRVDGGANARGDGVNATGQCSLSALDTGISPALDLDGDTAGDLNSGTYALTFTIPGVLCQDTSGDGFLDLPNCTSWHSNQGTVANLGDEYDFKPDTKSKCVCDDTFQVPVRVEDASIKVMKSASPLSLPEPGGEFTFTVKITNEADVESVQITSIIDDIHGDVGGGTYDADNNTCPALITTVLGPKAFVSCMFKADVWGNALYTETDTVTVTAYQPSNGSTVSDFDDATVSIDNLVEDKEPGVDKTVTGVANCSLEATYQVVVSNTSTVDALTIDALTDDQFGDITSVHGNVLSTGCKTGGTIASNSNYTCSFVGKVSSANCNFTHTNTVTAEVTDDDGFSFAPFDDAKVVVTVQAP